MSSYCITTHLLPLQISCRTTSLQEREQHKRGDCECEYIFDDEERERRSRNRQRPSKGIGKLECHELAESMKEIPRGNTTDGRNHGGPLRDDSHVKSQGHQYTDEHARQISIHSASSPQLPGMQQQPNFTSTRCSEQDCVDYPFASGYAPHSDTNHVAQSGGLSVNEYTTTQNTQVTQPGAGMVWYPERNEMMPVLPHLLESPTRSMSQARSISIYNVPTQWARAVSEPVEKPRDPNSPAKTFIQAEVNNTCLGYYSEPERDSETENEPMIVGNSGSMGMSPEKRCNSQGTDTLLTF
jgi:hypothetical protein